MGVVQEGTFAGDNRAVGRMQVGCDTVMRMENWGGETESRFCCMVAPFIEANINGETMVDTTIRGVSSDMLDLKVGVRLKNLHTGPQDIRVCKLVVGTRGDLMGEVLGTDDRRFTINEDCRRNCGEILD